MTTHLYCYIVVQENMKMTYFHDLVRLYDQLTLLHCMLSQTSDLCTVRFTEETFKALTAENT
jgi:hypothetical protein